MEREGKRTTTTADGDTPGFGAATVLAGMGFAAMVMAVPIRRGRWAPSRN